MLLLLQNVENSKCLVIAIGICLSVVGGGALHGEKYKLWNILYSFVQRLIYVTASFVINNTNIYNTHEKMKLL